MKLEIGITKMDLSGHTERKTVSLDADFPSYVADSFKYLKGYCDKHSDCEKCQLNTVYGCFLQLDTTPCDWRLIDG